METSKKFQISFQGSNRGIFMKNTPNNNFLTVQLIYTLNIPIGSAQQVDNSETSKIPKFDCRGSIGKFHEKIPQTITFQLFNLFPQTVYRSIQVDKRRTWNHQTCFKFHSRGATGEFSQKNAPSITFQPFNQLLSQTFGRLFQIDKCPRKSYLLITICIESAKQQILMAKNFSVYSQL